MNRGIVLRHLAAASALVTLAAFAAPPVSAAGNAHLRLQKTVDPAQVSINPNIGVSLAVDKTTAIPADTLTYTAVVTNPTATMGMGGNIDAQTDPNTDGVVVYYWDELEVCAIDCGNALADPNWRAVATFEAGQAGYQPIEPPALHTGMSFATQPVVRSGVVYPTSGDLVLGTQISAASTATWTYAARVVLAPAQIAALADPTQVIAMRNVIHFEVTPRNSSAAQPFTDLELFTNPFTTSPNPGAIANVTVKFTLPDGTTTSVPATSMLAPGASATATAQFKVPVPTARVPGETEPVYVMRLQKLDGSALTASAVAAGAGFSGTVYATSSPVTTNEFVPIVTIAKSGPSTVDAGTTETNPLALQNIGGAPATGLTLTDTVPSGGSASVSGTPASIAPGASASATASFPVPISQATGTLTDTASVTWQDANGNAYGSLTSSFTTQVHNVLFGATLTLAPATAGPNTPGTTQTLTATLKDSHGNPIPGQVVQFAVTGANTATGSATTDVNGVATFTYTGANSGNDSAQATVSAPGITITSNTSAISWLKLLQHAALTPVQGNFFANAANSCSFDVGPSATALWSQTFPDIMFNADPSVLPHDISRIDNFTRPMFDKTTDVNGNYNGQIMAQGNGFQAGAGNILNFYAEFTGGFVINQPGDLTFRILHTDGYIFGVGGGATRVNGDLEGSPPATTPFNNYPVVGAFNLSSTGSSNSGTVTVHFPAAGTYPFELDYTKCGNGGPLYLDLLTESFIAQTSSLAVFVGYADGLRGGGSIFPFPWNGSPNVNFVGCTTCVFDAGALRFDNNSAAPVTFDSITVDLGVGQHLDIWQHGITLPAGQLLIMTQTAQFNFDTSDFANTPCFDNNGVIPTVNVTIGGVTTSYKDVNQVLNTGGFDSVCIHNESQPWHNINGVATTINLPVPPAASLNLMPFNIPGAVQGQSVAVTVSALDGAGNPQVNLPVTLQVFGANAQTQSANTDAAGLATFSYAGNFAGSDTLQASAFVTGFRVISNQGSVLWTPPGGNTNNPLGASITAFTPADGAIVTKPVTIDATIAPPAGQSITSWKVSYRAQDPGPEVTIASGSGAPPSPLATFDPTLLPNDAYAITVQVTSSNGAVQQLSTTVAVMGNLKLGRYSTTYQDMSVPVNGFQMEVRRTYDSIDKSSGDFGVGWRVSLSNFRVAPNRMLGAGGWIQYNKSCVFGLCITGFKNSAPRYVTVTFPDQHTEVFDFTPGGGTNIFWTCTPQFTARGVLGTTSTLVPLDDTTCSYRADGNLYGATGIYSPHRFQLTTHAGMVFVLDQTLGLVSETDTNGNSLNLDNTGLHASNGQSIVYTRDASGRITRLTGPTGETVTYAYTAANDLGTSIDRNNHATTYTYDGNHDLLSSSGAQPLQKLQYDAGGRLIAVSDAFGNTTQIQNDLGGQTQTLVDPAGRMTTVFHFDDLGDAIQTDKIADGVTVTTNATFDSAGRTLSTTDGMRQSQSMQYDASGNMTLFTDANGNRFHFAYNSNGQLLSWTDDAGTVLGSYVYDSSGNLLQINDPSCPGCQYTYDSAGRLSSQKAAVGGGSSYFYDSFGHATKIVDPLGDAFLSNFDASGHLISRTDPLGGMVQFTYDGNGKLLSQQDALHHITSATYTPNGDILTMTDPAQKTTTYAYDAAGRTFTVTDRNNVQVQFAYDADGRVTSQTLPGGDVSTRAYDGFGRLTQIANNSAVVAFTYDADGRVLTQTTTGTTTDPLPTTTFTYTYDADGNRLTSAGPDGTIKNIYNELSRLSGLVDPSQGSFQFGFDSGFRLSSITRPNGVRDDMTFDASGDLLSPTSSLNGATISTVSYAYGPGRLTSSFTDPRGTTTSYTYDKLMRLVGASSSHAQESYQYDAGSNRTAAQTGLGSFSYTYDSAGRITSDGVFNYAWDAEGNLTSKVNRVSGATTNYSFNPRHQLTSAQLPDGSVTSFQYDPMGRRLLVNANGAITKYAYDGDALRIEYNGADALQASYVSAVGLDTPLEMRRSAISYYYVQDALGSVRALLDPHGAVAQAYSYDSYGNQAATTSLQNPFTYTGREFDSSTGLYYNRARYYDPATGRFISEDPELSLNRYTYGADAPTNYTDPTGAASAYEYARLFVIVGTVAGALGNAITTAFAEWKDGCFDWRDVLLAGFAGAVGGFVTSLLLVNGGNWAAADIAGGTLSGGIQDAGSQVIHHPGRFDGGEFVGAMGLGALSGLFGGLISGDMFGYRATSAGLQDASGEFIGNPSLGEGLFNNLLMGFFGADLQDYRNHTVCP